jgi:hypothetical protein
MRDCLTRAVAFLPHRKKTAAIATASFFREFDARVIQA